MKSGKLSKILDLSYMYNPIFEKSRLFNYEPTYFSFNTSAGVLDAQVQLTTESILLLWVVDQYFLNIKFDIWLNIICSRCFIDIF